MTSPPPGPEAVRVEGLTKDFPAATGRTRALCGIDATIARGAITGLVGSDGAGKTTFLRLVAGLLRPTAGRVEVLGRDGTREPDPLQGRVGYMPQRFGLYEDLKVRENLSLYADLYGLPETERAVRFDELMAFTGLGAFGERLAGNLSGGMKQKLGLACTLIHPPELLLLDEPSVGVDPLSRRELWRIVRELVGPDMSVVWSTAYQDEAERCDDVLVLHEGRLLAQGPPRDFLRRVEGRSFAARVAPERRRSVARAVAARPGVLDAVIQAGTVRVLVAAGASQPVSPPELEDDVPTRFAPVPARFEDAFVARLWEEGGGAGKSAAAASIVGTAPSPPTPATSDERATATVIEIHDLTKTFGTFRAVDRVNFTITRGEIFGLLGPNGAGKSTTFRMLCGLLPPTDGEATVLGIDLRRSAPEARARIGYMSQKFSLYAALSGRQNLEFFGAAYRMDRSRRCTRTDRLLEDFGLADVATRPSDDLPLGQKQRLALACALLHEPEILFLDEPTSGVDPLARREFWWRINALAEGGVTVMVTTHFLDEAEYCDRLGIIYEGRLVALGTPDGLKNGARTHDRPDPTLDDAFVELIEAQRRERAS